ncbi:ribonuclease H [Trifolium pratense]|uniref:Ribonuclease H n=1 Tax=Trifolium pratense TaxID=57577 RepID=A0A2K3L3V1_TRIPR|nr:ribonuclease H [Trifolium pratense]
MNLKMPMIKELLVHTSQIWKLWMKHKGPSSSLVIVSFASYLLLLMMSANSRIFVWNCRGAANTSFLRYCKQYMTTWRPVMVVIVETRCDPNRLKRTFNLLEFDGFLASDVDGYAGGIVIAWKENLFMVDLIYKTFQFMHLKVQYPEGREWFFTATYASPNEENRRILWNDLKDIADSMQSSWLLAGDFNDILGSHEKKGGAPVSLRKCNKFRERMEACNVFDIGAVGPKFTWRGPIYQGGQRIYERLDRAIGNDMWRLAFPDGYVRVLPRIDFSDHHPILICPVDAPHPVAPKQFCFESAWLLDKSYDNMLKNSWKLNGDVIQSLNQVQRDIKDWKFNTFDHVMRTKKEIMVRLGGIQRSMYNSRNVGGLCRLEKKLHAELNNILRQEELMWYQRSRAKWLTDGDRNTKYYHIKTVARRRKNNILMLKDSEGHWVDDAKKLQEMVNDFYKILFSNNNIACDWSQSEITYPMLERNYMDRLNAPINNEEVKCAIFSMKPWKAPGPDGFPAGFYQKSWEVVKEKVCDFVKEVWRNPSAISTVNQTDICLIPKISQPEYVNQFRPISLCNSIYKVVSKVVVARLKECIPIIVSPFQTGFVPGRNIHENIVVAKEMMHSMERMKGNKGYFAIKVDLSKAYDKINWEFIWRVLMEIKLPDNLIKLIMHMVTSVETNVKWNGARNEYFRPKRGIRQGDPISPYLFVMCVDKLSHLISHVVNKGEWKALRAGKRGPYVSHLMFADDLLLFGEATEAQMNCVMRVLNKFYSIKSLAFERQVSLASILGFR